MLSQQSNQQEQGGIALDSKVKMFYVFEGYCHTEYFNTKQNYIICK